MRSHGVTWCGAWVSKTAAAPSIVYVYLGNGKGGFSLAGSYATGNSVYGNYHGFALADLRVATSNGAAAVVNNTLYVIGGQTASGDVNTVWAFSPKTKTWTKKSAMPTIRFSLGAVVENNIIYAIGGVNVTNCCQVNTVESYNPATDTWKEEAPLSLAKEGASVGLIGTTIVAADGYSSGSDTGDNEGYDSATNVWMSLTSDPDARSFACAGAIPPQLYVASGWNGEGAYQALSTTESFKLSPQTWTTLAPMPTPVLGPGSAVYEGQLYCFGGSTNGTNVLNTVQIYQP